VRPQGIRSCGVVRPQGIRFRGLRDFTESDPALSDITGNASRGLSDPGESLFELEVKSEFKTNSEGESEDPSGVDL
jgi:hypothetical protein